MNILSLGWLVTW